MHDSSPPIERRTRPGPPPLSFAQERLWFLDQLEPGNVAYTLSQAIPLPGTLDVLVLKRSLDALVQRHEVLRTTFAAREGRPFQVIHRTLTLPLPVVDLQGLCEGGRKGEARRLTIGEARRPFDLARGPLVRVVLLRLGEEHHVLLRTTHHIVSDDWSMGVLMQELVALYGAFSSGRAPSLPELPIQYADFAVWQREWLQGEILERQLSYWRHQLSELSALELPTDRPRPPIQTYRGERQPLALSRDLADALRALSREEGCTTFMALLAAFQALLHRYTGQEDIVVGTPIANRNRAEIEGLIGFFVNTLVLRTDLSGRPGFRELMRRARKVTLEAHAHQDLPFEMLVEELQPERSLSRTPLFQVAFALQNAPTKVQKPSGSTSAVLETDSGTAKFDLTLAVEETEGGLRGTLEFNADIFNVTTIHRMLRHFRALLAGAVANPDQPLSELPFLGKAESHQLLAEWNDAETDFAQKRCIHSLFEAQVERTPDAVAVVFEDQQLTYRQLDRQANRLAQTLRRMDVGPEVRVGICIRRSIEMVVGLLGILKAGGAYVPLDPMYPKERVAYMLQDARARVLLTQEELLEGLPECKASVVLLDADREAIAQEGEEKVSRCKRDLLDCGTVPDNLAYVIYTSGSTGVPKGTGISHRNVNRLFEATDPWFHFGEGDVWTLFHTYAFDFSVWELWGSLLYGGRLVVVSYLVSRSPQAFYELLCREQITVLNQTPLAFRQLAWAERSLDTAGGLVLRLVIFGGEALELNSLRPWFERHGDRRPLLVNMYGITETTVHVTYCPLTMAVLEASHGSVIGRPIPDLQVYILDQHLQPVPIGVPGEMYVGGAGLSRGYLNRPDLTAERFVPNPFSDQPGDRLYRSGDLGRYLVDGGVEYLGRIDTQVKIRGHRIEVQEIEAVLGQHPGIREAVVLAREDEPGDKRLVAYLVMNARAEPTITEIRRFLAEKLPGYMVPSAFLVLETLPLTSNGKIDRRALPVPGETRPELEQPFVPPCTPVEEALAAIWAQVLGLGQVGVHDNFFELGGDSILSIQIIAKANQIGLQLTPKQIFEHQTIAELACVTGTIPIIQAEQGIVTGPVPLTPVQHWFFELFEQDLANPHHFNQALLLEVRRSLDAALLEEALRQLLLCHDGLRLRFERTEAGWQQVNPGPGDAVPFTQFDLSALPITEQRATLERVAAELQASLNLSVGPLIRVALFLNRREPGRLLIIIHHLIVDGVSWRILLRDLETAYQQLCQGQAIELPPKTTSFKRWAERLVEYAQSEEVKGELDEWLARPWERVSSLPIDYPGGDNTVDSARTVWVSASAQETEALLRDIPKAYRTRIDEVLLTALAQAFARWTGSPTLLVDLEGHGREVIFDDVDLSRTVGWFTAIYPVLLDLRESRDPEEALRAVKEQLRRIPNRGIHYGILRYLTRNGRVARRLEALPQPEVSFNYFGQLDQVLSEDTAFRLAPEDSGPHHSLDGQRRHLLEIDGSMSGGRLQLSWTYSKNLHRRSTVEGIAQAFVDVLGTLIACGQSLGVRGYTPSDFPAATLDQGELDEFISRLSQSGGR